jgi:hypothetical protein
LRETTRYFNLPEREVNSLTSKVEVKVLKLVLKWLEVERADVAKVKRLGREAG